MFFFLFLRLFRSTSRFTVLKTGSVQDRFSGKLEDFLCNTLIFLFHFVFPGSECDYLTLKELSPYLLSPKSNQ
jgi:hypothetical protein